jgi:hypothetical protein
VTDKSQDAVSKPGNPRRPVRLVYVGRPEKPISEMTEQELDAYADAVWETAKSEIRPG